jgi:hypothetical protein
MTVKLSRRMALVGHVARRGEMKTAYNDSVTKPEVKRPLGTHSFKVVSSFQAHVRG